MVVYTSCCQSRTNRRYGMRAQADEADVGCPAFAALESMAQGQGWLDRGVVTTWQGPSEARRKTRLHPAPVVKENETGQRKNPLPPSRHVAVLATLLTMMTRQPLMRCSPNQLS